MFYTFFIDFRVRIGQNGTLLALRGSVTPKLIRLGNLSIMIAKNLSNLFLVCAVLGIMTAARDGLCQNCAPPPGGIVGWWPGEGDNDDLVNGNNGVSAGNATFSAGVVGRAFTFD